MRFLPILIGHDKGRPKIAKYLGKDSIGEGVDKGRSDLAAFVIHGDEERLRQGNGHNDDADVTFDEGEDFILVLRGEGRDGGRHGHADVLIELGELGTRDVCPGHAAAKMGGGEVEVSPEVVAAGFAGVAEGDGRDAGQDAVLGHFGAQAGETEEQGTARHHAPLGFVAHHVQLPRVQLLVHCGRVAWHPDGWNGMERIKNRMRLVHDFRNMTVQSNIHIQTSPIANQTDPSIMPNAPCQQHAPLQAFRKC